MTHPFVCDNWFEPELQPQGPQGPARRSGPGGHQNRQDQQAAEEEVDGSVEAPPQEDQRKDGAVEQHDGGEDRGRVERHPGAPQWSWNISAERQWGRAAPISAYRTHAQ